MPSGRLRTLPRTFTTPDLDPEERQFLIDVFLQIARSDGLSKVDYKAMAEALGFKTPASATTAWYDLKKKLKNAVADEVASAVAASGFGAAVIPNVKGKGKGKAESKTAAPAAAPAATTATGAGLRRSGRKPNVSEAPKTDEKEKPKRKSRPLTTEEKIALIKSEIDPMLLLCRIPRDEDISDGSGSEGDMHRSDGRGND